MAKHTNTDSFFAEIQQEPVLWRGKKRLLFLGLPWTFTNYELTASRLRISSGFLKKTEDDIRLYRVSDVTFFQTLFQRIAGLGTLCIMSSDTSQPEAHLTNIKDARKLKDLIVQKVDESRRKSGVVTSEIVGAGGAKPIAPPPSAVHANPPENHSEH